MQIHAQYENYRRANNGAEKQITTMVDQLTHDINVIHDLTEKAINSLTARPKTQHSTRVSQKSRSQRSHKSSHRSSYILGSNMSRSSASNRTSSSEIYRRKQLEAQAKAVELQAQLQAAGSASEIDIEMARLENKKKTLQIQSEIIAEQRKAAIFGQAYAEELQDSGLLLRTMHQPKGEPGIPYMNHDTMNKPVPVKPVDKPDNHIMNQTTKTKHTSIENFDSDIDSSDDSDVELDHSPSAINAEKRSETVITPINTAPCNHSHENNSNSDNDISHIVTGLAEAISSAFNMSRLPPPEPFVFNGDPIKYPDWSFAFDNLIGNKPCGIIEKLHYLKRYVSGKALEVVDGYFLLQSPDAYQKARADLQRRFGDPFTISESFRTKIDHWPVVKSRDHEGLRKLSDFLQQCLTAQRSNHQLAILDDNRENKKIVAKLSEYIARKWIRQATNYSQRHGAFPRFTTFCQFLSKEADVSCNPLFHDLKPQPDHKPLVKKSYDNKRTYVTQQSAPNQSDNRETYNTENNMQCIYCKMSNHATADCGKVNYLPFTEQQRFIKDNHLCFKCLDNKHSYKECKTEPNCKTCKNAHPSALHRAKTMPRQSCANTRKSLQTHDKPEHPAPQQTALAPKTPASTQQVTAPANSSS